MRQYSLRTLLIVMLVAPAGIGIWWWSRAGRLEQRKEEHGRFILKHTYAVLETKCSQCHSETAGAIASARKEWAAAGYDWGFGGTIQPQSPQD